jgi:hypothetical protein
MACIESSRKALLDTLDQLTHSQMTSLQDQQGWTIKDHIAHLTAWEHSVVYFLGGKPRSAGLKVDSSLLRDGSYDEINALIYARTKVFTLEEVLEGFHKVHQELLKLLEGMNDVDLKKEYREYVAEEGGDERIAMEVIYSNTAGHYAEHQGWIEGIVEAGV